MGGILPSSQTKDIAPYHFVAFIRHGERVDKVPGGEIRNPVDPMLTRTGAQQGRQAAEYLETYFNKSDL